MAMSRNPRRAAYSMYGPQAPAVFVPTSIARRCATVAAVTRQRYGAVMPLVAALAWAGCSGSRPAVDTYPPPEWPVETFATDKGVAAWTFSHGPEWPGASGSMTRRDTGGRTGDGVLVLAHDFSGGGAYVAAIADLPRERPVEAVRMWLHKPADNLMIVRAVDAQGETFQKDLRYHYPGWQQVEVSLDNWTFSWGGDGVFDQPAKRFDVLIQNDGGVRVGELLIDDVEWVYAATPAAPADVRTSIYRESDFHTADWRYAGAEGGGIDRGLWSYRFTDAADACGVHYGRSVLGEPATMILTVESDGSGHELTAMCGSHFQSFHINLGKLDAPGERTFTVPMGDMTAWRHEGGENDGIVRYPLRLENIGIRRAPGGADRGTVRLKSLAFETRYADANRLVVIPAVQRIAGGRVRFSAVLGNLGDEPLAGQLEYRIQSFDHVLREGALPAKVAPGTRDCVLYVDAAFGRATMLEGSFRFVADDFATPSVSTTIAQADTAGADLTLNPHSRIGAGMYLYRYHGRTDARQGMDALGRLAAAAGVKWTREEFHWNWIERVPGEYDFSFFDQLVDSATEHGISVYGLMCYWTEWTGQPLTEDFIAPYCDYLRAVVGRYKDRIKHWEIWNEPNVFFWPGPKELYPKLVAAAYQAIKETDPEAQVLACSTAGIDVSFIKLVLEQDPPFDALTVHPYRHDLDPHGFIKELQDASAMTGGRQVWITEMGWPSHLGGLTERDQAGYVARTYVSALAAPAVRSVAWYDFREDGADPFYNEHHFGLVRQDLTPKIGYRALAAVGNLLGGATFDESSAPADGLIAFRFRAGERSILALWSADRTRLIGLEIDGPGAQILNAMGEPAAVTVDRGMHVVRLDRNLPAYVLGEGTLELTARDWPADVRPAQAAYHPGDMIAWVEQVRDAQTRVFIKETPPGWNFEAGTLGPVRIPPDAAPGRYGVTVGVSTVPNLEYELPIELTVAPLLIRG